MDIQNQTSDEMTNNGAAPETQGAPEETPAPAPETAPDPTEALRAELAEANDKYLRMLAEYDNYRRRSQKEKQNVWADAVSDTVKELLPIADNLERAVRADGDAEAIRAGLDMTMSALNTMLSKLGLTAYGEPGEAFDPNLHNAVMHVEDDTVGESTVVEVFQRGYRLGDKVIRFAMVKVAN